ncbi:adenosylcobinamide-phosphate synthase CbiB [Bacillus sp. DNRA2]|uniref:adenosylcobinamide-phosphate synthase CbiB n=1 Tax=Bacillus sp. DNRA2 TaxID=2723053 RepID=UPI001B7D0058|nr:adenosylcobinamide-phosphate synthase CbiB [Bacillus sp. DNRA2]
MFIHAIYIFIAYLVDLVVGDPRFLPHPVVIIGKYISRLEKLIRKVFPKEEQLKRAGLLLPLLIVGGTYLVVALLIYGAGLIHDWLAVALEIWLISTTIAVKGLGKAGMEVYQHLKNNNLTEARKSLGMIVGRDTEQLDESEISRGTVETVAENIVDAIISPLFFAVIGGAPLAMAYRAVNTLDSMVGYKNEKYQNLGWASARLDDVANFIPARLTVVALLFVVWIKAFNVRNALKTILRDARKHPSPNSGFTEAGVAGALGIQLGGLNYYGGIASNRAKMGDPYRKIIADDIINTVRIMMLTAFVFCLSLLTITFVINFN